MRNVTESKGPARRGLSVAQRNAARLRAEGISKTEVARRLDTTRQAVTRWHSWPEFREAVAEYRRAYLEPAPTPVLAPGEPRAPHRIVAPSWEKEPDDDGPLFAEPKPPRREPLQEPHVVHASKVWKGGAGGNWVGSTYHFPYEVFTARCQACSWSSQPARSEAGAAAMGNTHAARPGT